MIDFLNSHIILEILLAFLCALVLTAYFLPVIIRVSNIKGLVDSPNERTSHKGNIPNLGGMGIFIGFILSSLLFLNITNSPSLQYIMLGTTAMFFVGLRDDITVLLPLKKLLAELLIFSIVIYTTDVRFTSLHNFLQVENIGYIFSFLLTLFVYVVITNSLNLIDGIDGLAAGISALVLCVLGFYFLQVGNIHCHQLSVLCFAMIGALVPFFIYNVFGTVHKIFMGDTGSLILGFIITYLIIEFNEVNVMLEGIYHIEAAPAFSINLLIVPLFDTARVFTLRILSGKSPFKADHNHIHHRLLAAGFSHRTSTLILMIVTIFFTVIGFLCKNMSIIAVLIIDVVIASILMEILILKVRKVRRLKEEANTNN